MCRQIQLELKCEYNNKNNDLTNHTIPMVRLRIQDILENKEIISNEKKIAFFMGDHFIENSYFFQFHEGHFIVSISQVKRSICRLGF